MRKELDNGSFCVKPFTQYSSFNDNRFRLCCSAYEASKRISTKNKKIEDIFNSPYMKEVRKKLIEGRKISECQACYGLEAMGAQSDRLMANEDFFEERKIDIDKVITNDYKVKGPEVLDLRVGNICNLRCQSCFPDLSIGVHQDVEKIRKKDKNILPRPTNKKKLPEGFKLKQLKNTLPNLKILKIIGGEPLLSRPAYELLDYCTKNDYAKNIELHFHTNLTLFNESFLGLCKSFNKCLIHFSLDAYGDLNDYLRYPSQWKRSNENLNKMINFYKDSPHVRLGVSPVIQLSNIMSFSKLIDYLVNEVEIFHHQMALSPILLVDPEHYSPYIAPRHLKQEAVQKMNFFYQNQDSHMQRKLAPLMQEFNTILEGEEDIQKLKKYIMVTQYYDELRGNSIEEVFPEFENLKKYVHEREQ